MLESDVRNSLRMIEEKIEDRDILIWAYCCLSIYEMSKEAYIFREDTDKGMENFRRLNAINEFMRQAFTSADDLSYQKFHSYCVKKLTTRKANPQGDYILSKGGWDIAHSIDPGISDGYLLGLNSPMSLERYSYFQGIYNLYDQINKTDWIQYQNFVQNITKPSAVVVKDDGPLSGRLPTVTREEIIERARALTANDYGALSVFGSDLEFEGSKAIAPAQEHILRRAAQPFGTQDRLGEIMNKTVALKSMQYVQDDPGFMARRFNRTSLGTADVRITPFQPLVDMLRDLPDIAQKDSALFRHDLDVLQHGKALAAAYIAILGDLYEALDAERPRLVAEADQFSIGIVNIIETRLEELQKSRQIMTMHALSFDKLAVITGERASGLTGMAAIPGKIRLSVINAMTSYRLYALRRMQAFGQTVDEQLLKSINLTSDALRQIQSANPDKARLEIGQALDTILADFGEVNDVFCDSVQEQNRVILDFNEKAACLHDPAVRQLPAPAEKRLLPPPRP